MNGELVRLEQASVVRDGRSILERVDLRLEAGEQVSLIGPNGAGKSTLIKVVLGLMPLSSGQRWIRDRLRLGYVPQQLQVSRMLPLRVADVLALGQSPSPAQRASILAETGVQQLLQHSWQDLSGGERQRALLARALLARPELLVLDEPMQGLDIQAEAELSDYLRTLPQRHGCALLMVSHDLHWVMQGTERVVCLNRHVCCSGSPAQVQQAPAYQALFGRHHVFYQHHHEHCRHEDEQQHACGGQHGPV